MNYRLPLVAAAVLVCAGSATLWLAGHRQANAPAPQVLTSAQAKQLAGKVPVWFEQLPGGEFASRSMGHPVVLADRSASWKMKDGSNVRMQFQNANSSASRHGVQRLAARMDRFVGNDRSKWTTNGAAFERVAYDSLYNGVDLVFYGQGHKMEHDFIVAPKADPNQIRMSFSGAKSVALDANGNLTVASTSGQDEVTLARPVAYQNTDDGRRNPVEARFVVGEDNSVGFAVGSYDESRSLVIDPVVQYASYFGGSGQDEFVAAAVDLRTDSVWLVGSTTSTDLQLLGDGLVLGASVSNRDILVAQFIGAGSGQLSLKYASTLGGTGDEEATALAVAPNGLIYIVGAAASADFPTVNAYSTVFQGLADAIVVGIDPTQNGTGALVYSTFLGGTAEDHATAVFVDSRNRVYVAGYTTSIDFPTSSGAITAGNRGGYDAFAVRLDTTSGSNGLTYSTTYGGTSTDYATGIAVDARGRILLSGWTYSSDFPATGTVPYYNYIGGGDAFLAAFDPTINGLDGIVYTTFLGGTGLDVATSMQLGANGHIYIAGYTESTDFPIVGNAPQRKNAGNADMFVMELDTTLPASQWIVFSTYLGGSGDDIARGMAVDSKGRVNLIGYTHPLNSIPSPTAKLFPTTANAVQSTPAGLTEMVIARIDGSLPPEQSLTFSTFWGGPVNDLGFGIAADPRGCLIYAAGSVQSDQLLTVSYAFQNSLSSPYDAYFLSIDTCSNTPSRAPLVRIGRH